MLSPVCKKMIKEGRGKDLLKCWAAVEGYIHAREGMPPSPGQEFKPSKKLINTYMKGRTDGLEIKEKLEEKEKQ